MQIQLIRNATLRINVAGSTFLVDPWLAGKGAGRSYAGKQRSPLVELPMPAQQVIADIDAVIISHLHSDHFDEAARAILPRNVPVLCPPRLAEEIRAFDFTDVREIEGDFRFAEVAITCTDGLHWPPEVLDDMGPVAGFVFRGVGEPVLYWAGDTILCAEVRSALATHRPDVMVVHACGAQWDGVGPLVMNADMVAETLALAPAATIVATHLDTVDHTTLTRSDLWDASRGIAGADRLLIPADGEILSFEV